MLATKPRIVSLKIKRMTADKAQKKKKKVVISFPVIIENIFKIAKNHIRIRTTWIKLSIGLSLKESNVFK